MIKMISEASHVYNGKQLHADDEFEATEPDAKVIELLKRGRRASADKPVTSTKRTYRRRDMQAQA